jgi:hypothetical protein
MVHLSGKNIFSPKISKNLSGVPLKSIDHPKLYYSVRLIRIYNKPSYFIRISKNTQMRNNKKKIETHAAVEYSSACLFKLEIVKTKIFLVKF